MDVRDSALVFDEATVLLSRELATLLFNLPIDYKRNVREIRLRVECPILLSCGKETFFVNRDASVSTKISNRCYIVESKQLQETFLTLCEHSLHAYTQQIQNGFIPLRGGHRAGIAATALYEQGKIKNISHVSSIVLRIAQDHPHFGQSAFPYLFSDQCISVLIAGPPSSGKTTLLRNMARYLSGGEGGYQNVVIVDERQEIASMQRGVPQKFIGISCDVLNGYTKGEGISLATRSLSPDWILCDEIGLYEDAQAILQGVHAGVRFLASAHAGKIEDLWYRPQIQALFDQRVFSHIVFLKDHQLEILRMDDLYESYRHLFSDERLHRNRTSCGISSQKARIYP